MNETEAIVNGDVFLYEQVFHKYHKKLYFFFLKYTRSGSDAEELVQVTFVKLWQSRKGLSRSLPLSPQLFSIAKSCLIDDLRRKSKETKRQEQMVNVLKNSPLHEVPPDFDTAGRIADAIAQLPPVRRKVFTMSRIEDLSHKEISKELSISVKTIETHINKAIKQLRRVLTSFWF